MSAPGPAWVPFVSVVLPVRNEAKDLGECLDAVLAQDYPIDRMEVLVADGRSDDATRDIIEGYARRDPRVRLVDNPGRIVPTGLNAAIREFRGDILVRVDGHTLVDRDYVAQSVAALGRTGADVVGGAMTAIGTSAFGRAVAYATSTPMGVGGSSFHYAGREEEAESVYMGSFRRDVFERFGLFDERCVRNQDDEFNYRLREGGGRIVLAPGMRSRYFPRETPRALWRQYYQYGFYKVLVARLHPTMMRPRHFVPSLFAAAVAAFAAVAALLPAAALAAAALLAVHALLSLAFSAKRAGKDFPAWMLVPVATFIVHAAYGSGFLWGWARLAVGRVPWQAAGAKGGAR